MERRPKCKHCKDRFYPLNNNALQKYCLKTDECIKAFSDHNKDERQKKQLKDWNKEKPQRKIKAYSSKYKKELGDNINKLSRMIDTSFGYKTCIDCHRGYGGQTDASHFHNVGLFPNLRWNLDVLHSSNSSCNQYHGGRKEGYYEGLIERYDKEYADYIKHELPKLYPRLGLSSQEIFDALTTVRKLIRDFDTYKFKDARNARKQLNLLIGIYK